MNMYLKELKEKKDEFLNREVKISGWIRNHRRQKDFGDRKSTRLNSSHYAT